MLLQPDDNENSHMIEHLLDDDSPALPCRRKTMCAFPRRGYYIIITCFLNNGTSISKATSRSDTIMISLSKKVHEPVGKL